MRPALALALALVAVVPMGAAAQTGRPQLPATDAARHTVADVLAQGPRPWLPAPVRSDAAPDAVVAADGSGTHRSLQAAIDALPAQVAGAEQRRHTIVLRPGSYRGAVCLRGKVPLLLIGVPGDASAVRIVDSRFNGQAKRAGVDASQPCHPELAADHIGTPGSASFVVASDDVQLAHLTVENDAMVGVRHGVGYPPVAGESGGAQAVALMVQADRVLLDHVRLLGHQDTLFARHPPGADRASSAARVLVQHSLIAGDVDFIFGDASLAITHSTILSRAGRRTGANGGHVLAPSTAPGQRLGILVTHSRLLAEPGVADASISLGRAWDAGVARGAWLAATSENPSPNGQALVRDSELGPHLAGWAASTSRRPFAAEGPAANRFAEFNNRPAGPAGVLDPATDLAVQRAAALALARQTLAANDGWAAADGGTRGGADALPADVHWVHDRASLAAALAPQAAGSERPRIVLLQGRIDLSVDTNGRPLGADDYRDPAFSWPAYAQAFDPATWGRADPSGPLEDARRRSARRQAERVLLRVPSRTTLLGWGGAAQLVNGGLMLEQVQDVIVRHLHFSDAYDHFPAWEPRDNGQGEWNSDYDNLTLRAARRVWVDHCRFDDGARPDAAEPSLLGRRMQHHDGLLDISKQSNLVTVSWNHFHGHAKTSLVGSGDGVKADEGLLKVTFHHNLWQDVAERAPRVRYGQVHLYNNLHVVSPQAPVGLGYSIGLGWRARIVSEHNAWLTVADAPARPLVRLLKGDTLLDRGNWHNGQPVDLLAQLRTANPAAALSADVGWLPALHGPIDPAAEVPARVLGGAGPGRAVPVR